MESPRLALARRVAAELEGRFGRDLLAAGVMGSVARRTDRRHSDVDLVLLVRRRVACPQFQMREGSLVTFLQETREEAWGEVRGAHLGLPEALGGWRSMRPLHDPDGLLRRLTARARRPPASQFRGAARVELLGAFEDLGKIRNAVDAGDPGAAREFAIWYTGGAALALLDIRRRVPASDATIFIGLARLGRLGEDLVRLRYGPLSVSETSDLAERTWAGLLREARRQGIPVRGLDGRGSPPESFRGGGPSRGPRGVLHRLVRDRDVLPGARHGGRRRVPRPPLRLRGPRGRRPAPSRGSPPPVPQRHRPPREGGRRGRGEGDRRDRRVPRGPQGEPVARTVDVS